MARRETTITVDSWGRRVEEKRAVAEKTRDDRRLCVETWNRAGEAAEYALKGYIHRRQFNDWPTRAQRPDLYTHDLRALFDLAGLDRTAMPPNTRAALMTVFGWDRDHAYTLDRLARAEARAMYEAVFGPEGLVEWLRSH